jgi:hypothetical protein
VIEAEVEDSPLHDMAWLGEVIDDAPEAVRAEYDRLVQLLGPDFPLADLVQRDGALVLAVASVAIGTRTFRKENV